MFRCKARKQIVEPLYNLSVTSTSLTDSGNRDSSINLMETGDYRNLTAVVMAKLQNRSTASVAVHVIALVGCKQEELVKHTYISSDQWTERAQ